MRNDWEMTGFFTLTTTSGALVTHPPSSVSEEGVLQQIRGSVLG